MKNRKKNIIWIVATVVLVMCVFGGCGSKKSPGVSPSPSQFTEPSAEVTPDSDKTAETNDPGGETSKTPSVSEGPSTGSEFDSPAVSPNVDETEESSVPTQTQAAAASVWSY